MNNVKKVFVATGNWFKSLFVSVNGKEPKLLSLLKNEKFTSAFASVICAVLGILVGFLLLLCINPEHAGEGIISILRSWAKSSRKQRRIYELGSTLVSAAPLIMCALSVLFSYKTGLFNIGVAGQYTIGACAALYAALAWHCPWYVCMLLAMVTGAVWAMISGALKAFCNVNEVISCIMTNWIGLYLTNMLLGNVKESTSVYTLDLGNNAPAAVIPDIGLSKLFGDNKYVTIAILFTVLIAIAVKVVLDLTTFGYELKATGYNKNAAKYAGMKDKKNIIVTMAISGALAGLGAAFYYLSGIEQYNTGYSSLPSMGFNGIAVAFLGGLNPVGSIFAGYFVQHIMIGGGKLDTQYYNPQVADFVIAIIIYLCAFVLFIKTLIAKGTRNAEKRESERVAKLRKRAAEAADAEGKENV